MRRVLLISGSLWLLTLVVAFMVGRSASSPPDGGKQQSNKESSSGAKRASSKLRYGGEDARRSGITSGISGQGARIIRANSPRRAVVELAQLVDPVERAKGFLALLETLEADQFLDVVADFRALGITEQRMSEYGMLLHA